MSDPAPHVRLDLRGRTIVRLANPFLRVADLGSGPGHIARALAASGHWTVAIDRSPTAVAVLRPWAGPGLTVRQGDGFTAIGADEVDAVIVAGLGSRTIGMLLGRDARWRRWSLILQPMGPWQRLATVLRDLDQGLAAAELIKVRDYVYPIVATTPDACWSAWDAEVLHVMEYHWKDWTLGGPGRRSRGEWLGSFAAQRGRPIAQEARP